VARGCGSFIFMANSTARTRVCPVFRCCAIGWRRFVCRRRSAGWGRCLLRRPLGGVSTSLPSRHARLALGILRVLVTIPRRGGALVQFVLAFLSPSAFAGRWGGRFRPGFSIACASGSCGAGLGIGEILSLRELHPEFLTAGPSLSRSSECVACCTGTGGQCRQPARDRRVCAAGR